jgi:hypothetical protein
MYCRSVAEGVVEGVVEGVAEGVAEGVVEGILESFSEAALEGLLRSAFISVRSDLKRRPAAAGPKERGQRVCAVGVEHCCLGGAPLPWRCTVALEVHRCHGGVAMCGFLGLAGVLGVELQGVGRWSGARGGKGRSAGGRTGQAVGGLIKQQQLG